MKTDTTTLIMSVIAIGVVSIALMLSWDRYKDYTMKNSLLYRAHKSLCEAKEVGVFETRENPDSRECWRKFDRKYGK